jgi:hypothetical protein
MNVLHAHIPPRTHDDQGKRVTAIYWGSSGRRFKICQPDAVQRVLSGPFGPQIGRRIPMKYPNELPTATNQQTLGSVESELGELSALW